MADYLYLIRGGHFELTPLTSEQMDQHMGKFIAWIDLVSRDEIRWMPGNPKRDNCAGGLRWNADEKGVEGESECDLR